MFQRSLTNPSMEGNFFTRNTLTPPPTLQLPTISVPQLTGKPPSEVKTLFPPMMTQTNLPSEFKTLSLPNMGQNRSTSEIKMISLPTVVHNTPVSPRRAASPRLSLTNSTKAPLARLASLKLKEGETIFSKISEATNGRTYTLTINTLSILSPADLSSGSKISPSGIKEIHKEMYKAGYNSERVRMSTNAAYLLAREMTKITAEDINLTKEQLIAKYGDASVVISDPSIDDLKILRNAYYRYVCIFVIREAAENAISRKHKTISDIDIIEANYVLDIFKLPRMHVDSSISVKPLTKNEFFDQWRLQMGYTQVGTKGAMTPPKNVSAADITKLDADMKSAEKDYALIGDVMPLNKYENYFKTQFPGSRFEYGCLNLLHNLASIEMNAMQQNALESFKIYSMTPVELYKRLSESKLQYLIEGVVKISGPKSKPSPVDFTVTPIWNRIQEIWLVLTIVNIKALVSIHENSPKIETVSGLVPSRNRTKASTRKAPKKKIHTIPFYIFFDAWFGTPKIIGTVEYSS